MRILTCHSDDDDDDNNNGQIPIDFGTDYDMQEGATSSGQAYEPYRRLTRWRLLGPNGEIVRPLPKENPRMVEGGYRLCGWLVPTHSVSSTRPQQKRKRRRKNKYLDQLQPIRVRIKHVVLWSFDRRSSLRGYWVRTKHAWYWLQDPCHEPSTVRVRVKMGGRPGQQQDDDDNGNAAAPLVAQLPSMKDLHVEMRARGALLSNLCDVLLFDPMDPQCREWLRIHANKTPYQVYQSFQQQQQQTGRMAFDYGLLQTCPAFVHQHLKGLHTSLLGPHSAFLRGLLQLAAKKKEKNRSTLLNEESNDHDDDSCAVAEWTAAAYLRSAQLAERRSGRLPWGEVNPHTIDTRVNPNSVLGVRRPAPPTVLQRRRVLASGNISTTTTTSITIKHRLLQQQQRPYKRRRVESDDDDDEDDNDEDEDDDIHDPPPSRLPPKRHHVIELSDEDEGMKTQEEDNGQYAVFIDDDSDDDDSDNDQDDCHDDNDDNDGVAGNNLPVISNNENSGDSGSDEEAVGRSVAAEADTESDAAGKNDCAFDKRARSSLLSDRDTRTPTCSSSSSSFASTLYSDVRMKEALVKRKKSLHPTPTRLSSGDWFDVVETNYTFADAATAATVSTDIDSVSSWEERLLICHAYRQACLQQLARVVRKLFKGLAYHVYEIWRDEAIQGLDKHRLTICQDYLIIMLESIVECSMVNNADMLETVKTHTGVDWEHGVEEVMEAARTTMCVPLRTACCKTQSHIRKLKGAVVEKQPAQAKATKNPTKAKSESNGAISKNLAKAKSESSTAIVCKTADKEGSKQRRAALKELIRRKSTIATAPTQPWSRTGPFHNMHDNRWAMFAYAPGGMPLGGMSPFAGQPVVFFQPMNAPFPNMAAGNPGMGGAPTMPYNVGFNDGWGPSKTWNDETTRDDGMNLKHCAFPPHRGQRANVSGEAMNSQEQWSRPPAVKACHDAMDVEEAPTMGYQSDGPSPMYDDDDADPVRAERSTRSHPPPPLPPPVSQKAPQSRPASSKLALMDQMWNSKKKPGARKIGGHGRDSSSVPPSRMDVVEAPTMGYTSPGGPRPTCNVPESVRAERSTVSQPPPLPPPPLPPPPVSQKAPRSRPGPPKLALLDQMWNSKKKHGARKFGGHGQGSSSSFPPKRMDVAEAPTTNNSGGRPSPTCDVADPVRAEQSTISHPPPLPPPLLPLPRPPLPPPVSQETPRSPPKFALLDQMWNSKEKHGARKIGGDGQGSSTRMDVAEEPKVGDNSGGGPSCDGAADPALTERSTMPHPPPEAQEAPWSRPAPPNLSPMDQMRNRETNPGSEEIGVHGQDLSSVAPERLDVAEAPGFTSGEGPSPSCDGTADATNTEQSTISHPPPLPPPLPPPPPPPPPMARQAPKSRPGPPKLALLDQLWKNKKGKFGGRR